MMRMTVDLKSRKLKMREITRTTRTIMINLKKVLLRYLIRRFYITGMEMPLEKKILDNQIQSH